MKMNVMHAAAVNPPLSILLPTMQIPEATLMPHSMTEII